MREIVEGSSDRWMAAYQTPGYGVRIAGYTANSDHLFVTISVWKLSEVPGIGRKATIDEIQEEPSINYPVDEDDDKPLQY